MQRSSHVFDKSTTLSSVLLPFLRSASFPYEMRQIQSQSSIPSSPIPQLSSRKPFVCIHRPPPCAQSPNQQPPSPSLFPVLSRSQVYGSTPPNISSTAIPRHGVPTLISSGPDRWLNDAYMAALPAGAYRPFERGPRNCIGQELAMLEGKVVLACVARGLVFEKVGLTGQGTKGRCGVNTR